MIPPFNIGSVTYQPYLNNVNRLIDFNTLA
jgi:hypothetical protein